MRHVPRPPVNRAIPRIRLRPRLQTHLPRNPSACRRPSAALVREIEAVKEIVGSTSLLVRSYRLPGISFAEHDWAGGSLDFGRCLSTLE